MFKKMNFRNKLLAAVISLTIVAEEVRNLAIRAADAAKNTSRLIENTIKSVHSGNDLTRLTQEASKDNIDIAGKVGRLVDEIAAASQEQAQGIDQINKAVSDMDKVTQQNAANAEESASASEEMNAQASQMKRVVDDLVALVGETSNGHGRGNGRHRFMLADRPENDRETAAAAMHREKAAVSLSHGARVMTPSESLPLKDSAFRAF